MKAPHSPWCVGSFILILRWVLFLFECDFWLSFKMAAKAGVNVWACTHPWFNCCLVFMTDRKRSPADLSVPGFIGIWYFGAKSHHFFVDKTTTFQLEFLRLDVKCSWKETEAARAGCSSHLLFFYLFCWSVRLLFCAGTCNHALESWKYLHYSPGLKKIIFLSNPFSCKRKRNILLLDGPRLVM